MRTFTRRLMLGSLALSLSLVAARGVLAGPPPWPPMPPFPHPKPVYIPQPWPQPVYYPRPIIRTVVTPVNVQYVDSANNPAPVANILLANPAENGVALRYRLNGGPVQILQAGYTAQINRVVVISFDRGGGAGWARYRLSDGSYKFVAQGGVWGLSQQSEDTAVPVADVAANPAPAH